MKRTNLVTKIVAVLLFIATVAYIGFYTLSSLSGGYRTAPAVLVEIDRSVSMTGVIVRDELCIESEEQYLSISAENGEMLAVGDPIAVAYSSEEALARASEIRKLELQEEYIKSVLDGSDTDSVSKKDSNIKLAITRLASAAARHKTDELASASLNLSALVLDQSAIAATAVDLTNVQNKISSLKQSASKDTKTLVASESGLFCSSADGYEFLTLDNIDGISPSGLEKLTETPQEVSSSVRGKMVYSNAWYYAAAMSSEDAAALEVGNYESLDFGRYCSQAVTALVVSIGRAEDDRCVAVFRCTGAMAEMLTIRFADATIVRDTIRGLRVPKEGCYVEQDDNGDSLTYVYISESGRAAKKYVSMAQDMGDYYLAEISYEDGYLRADNSIILTSREIYDGMLLK
ncbi:MAG: hypothetical protein EOM14_00805 [Clostridia bacterium]|nr:hypothetical protein [Clostridia bacterium]